MPSRKQGVDLKSLQCASAYLQEQKAREYFAYTRVHFPEYALSANGD